jgi:cytochrome c
MAPPGPGLKKMEPDRSGRLAAQNPVFMQSLNHEGEIMPLHRNILAAIVAIALGSGTAIASGEGHHDPQVSDRMSRSGFVLENGLAIPAFDAEKGRILFGSKGCVVCHSINGIGGEDAVEFAAEWMEPPMNAFQFAANMWRGAPAMIMMQEEELGEQIELTGEELAAIIAFVHSADEQKEFSKSDIPDNILDIMGAGHD